MDSENKLPAYVNVNYYPDLRMDEYVVSKKPFFKVDKLASISASLNPLGQLVAKAISSSPGGSGVYLVNTGNKLMHSANSGAGFIGALKTPAGAVGGGQAIMTAIPFDIAGLSTALVVMAIEHKLNKIAETQRDILEFLELKEKAKIKANINSLLDVINNYKYNYDNAQYRNSNYAHVLNIKKDAEESIILFESLILEKINNKTGFMFDRKAEGFLEEIIDKLNDYQLAIYAFTFSSLLDMLLLENFNKYFIQSILSRINHYQDDYVRTFKAAEKKVGSDFGKSVETVVSKGASKVSIGIGKVIEKVSFFGKNKLSDSFISGGNKLQKDNENKVSSKKKVLSESKKDLLEPLVENIKVIDLIHNESINLIFNRDIVYLDTSMSA